LPDRLRGHPLPSHSGSSQQRSRWQAWTARRFGHRHTSRAPRAGRTICRDYGWPRTLLALRTGVPEQPLKCAPVQHPCPPESRARTATGAAPSSSPRTGLADRSGTHGRRSCDSGSDLARRHERRSVARPPPRLVRSLPPLPALRVGLFVGLFCQPAGGFWRFVAVASGSAKSAESPVTTGLPCKRRGE
jgi:hypothetical protein